MRNPLQEQLLKAGLIKKDKAAQIVRQQANQRRAKAPVTEDHVDAAKLQAERAEHDRALSAERNAQLRANEERAQVRQIISTHQVQREGEIAYRFTDGDKIKELLVSEPQRAQLAAGALVIVRHDQGYALLQRAAADMVHARDATQIVLDHGQAEASASTSTDDAYYDQFKVPDDLIW